MNCDPRAMRDFASKVTALRGEELAVWRRPLRATTFGPTKRDSVEQRWEGEGGRLVTKAARS